MVKTLPVLKTELHEFITGHSYIYHVQFLQETLLFNFQSSHSIAKISIIVNSWWEIGIFLVSFKFVD